MLPPSLDIGPLLARRLSDGASPRSPRSPVTLLPHSPVVRTPRSPLLPAHGGAALAGVPELPGHYVPREGELADCRAALLAGENVTLVGPEGVGGVGKSTLAAALARDGAVLERFKDGVFWLILGPSVNPLVKAEELKVTMAMQKAKLPLWVPLEGTSSREDMRGWFQQTLRGRSCLLVLDNCTAAPEVELYRGVGFTVLVTTRSSQLAEQLGARQCFVPLVFGDLAPRILSAAAGHATETLPKLGDGVLGSYGGLPHELTLVGGLLKDQTTSAWPSVFAKLSKADVDLEELGYGSAAQGMQQSTAQLIRTLVVALEFLPPRLGALCRKLAVLTDGTLTPLHTLQLLWDLPTERDARSICRELAAKSLLIVTSSEDECDHVTIHDTQLDFLRRRHRTELPVWHAALVDAYAAQLDHIAYVEDDGYIVSNIAHHLKGSQRLDTLRELLYDTDWLERKLHNHGARSVADDFLRYLDERRDPQVATLCRAFQAAAPHCLLYPKLSMLGVQMASRLVAHVSQPLIPDWILFIRALLDEETYSQGTVPLWPMTPSLGQVSGGLLAQLGGHSSWVTGGLVSACGAWAATVSTDKTARVWDLASGALRTVLEGHTDHITDAALVSQEPPCLLTTSRDGTARVWDVDSGQQLACLAGHTDGVHACASAGRGPTALVLTAGDDYVGRVWRPSAASPGDPAGGWAQSATLQGHSARIRGVALADDGSLALTASDDGTARVWELPAGSCRHVLAGHADKVGGVLLLPGGTARALTMSSDATARLWDLAGGACLHVLAGHQEGVGGAAVTPDGRRAVTVSGDKTARLWDLATGAALRVLSGHGNWVNAVAIYDGGAKAITASVDRTARLWDLATGHCFATLQGHTSLVASVAANGEGTRALTVSSDKTARVWSLVDGARMYGTGHTHGKVGAVVVLPDGERCVSVGADGAARFWDCASGCPSRVALDSPAWGGASPPQMRAVAASGDGCGVAAAAGAEVALWDLGFMALQPRLAAVLQGHTDDVTCVALSHGGEAVVSGSADGTARVWDGRDAPGECLHVLSGHGGAITALELLEEVDAEVATGGGGGEGPQFGQPPPPRRRLVGVVTASVDGTARVWHPGTGQCMAVLSGHEGALVGVVAVGPPDGAPARLVTASADATARVWAAVGGGSGRWECAAVLSGHRAPLTALATAQYASGGGSLRVATGDQDGCVIIWDVEAGVQQHTVEAHSGAVTQLATGICDGYRRSRQEHPAGALVLSTGADGCASLWDVATGTQVGFFRGDAPMVAGGLSMAPSGAGWAYAMVGDAEGALHCLQLPKR